MVGGLEVVCYAMLSIPSINLYYYKTTKFHKQAR